MKIKSVRIAFTLGLLLTLLMLVFSCNSDPSASQSGPANTAPSSLLASNPDLCHNTTDSNRVERLNERLMNYDMGDSELNNRRGNSNHFTFNATSYNANTDANLRIVVQVSGRVIGEDDMGGGNKAPKMQKLLNFLMKSMRKGCIDRVSFEPMPTPTPSPGTPPSTPSGMASTLFGQRGFEWQACSHPEFPCQPDGHCSTGQVCVSSTPEPKGSPTPTPTPSD
jgi:hypothetical protein